MANKIVKTEFIPINLLEANKGQIEGLPKNPRFIKNNRYKALVKSIADTPEFLKLRELLVYQYGKKYITIGGNMRLRAAKELGYMELPCKVIPKDTPVEKLREYTIKDNNAFGDDDWDALSGEWEDSELEEWGIVFPAGYVDTKKHEDAKRAAWGGGSTGLPLCDLKLNYAYFQRKEFSFLSLFKRTKEGIPLTEIKKPEFVNLFSEGVVSIINKFLGIRQKCDWSIITTPRRRHKDWNFADNVCSKISSETGINYIDNVAEVKNRDRINPQISLLKEIPTTNIILFDDILTTGSTVRATRNLLQEKNVVCIIGINNN